MSTRLLLLGVLSCAPMSRGAAAQPPERPAAGTDIGSDPVNQADFREYKRRLFRLISEFKRYRTTVADIQDIMGMGFSRHEDRYNQAGWIVGVAPGFRSLPMNHRVSLYYDPVRGKATLGRLQFETTYYVNFAQAEPPMGLYVDPERCLTVAELEAALTAAHLPFRISPPSDPDRRFLSVGSDDFLTPDRMSLLAEADPKTARGAAGAHGEPDLAHACIKSVEVS